MALPRCILFDLDDTLISAHSGAREAWRIVVEGFIAELGAIGAAPVAQAIFCSSEAFWADPDRDRVWRVKLPEARRAIVRGALDTLAAAGQPALPAGLADRLADCFSAYREEQMQLFPDTHCVLDAVLERGIRLGLVTNGASAVQRAKLRRFALADRFQHIQIEQELGFGKPEPRAYHHALVALGVGAWQTWMVGDNLDWEVAGPQRLGIRSIWYDGAGTGLPPGSAVRPDHTIGRLAELLPLLEA